MIFTKKIFLKEIDSTSDYLIRLDKSIFVEEGVVVVTKFQERGRGRIGNSWISDPGKNLLFSFLFGGPHRESCVGLIGQPHTKCTVPTYWTQNVVWGLCIGCTQDHVWGEYHLTAN